MRFSLAILTSLTLTKGQTIRGNNAGANQEGNGVRTLLAPSFERKALGEPMELSGRSLSAASQADATPAQTFFVPFPEDELMADTFKVINSNAGGNVQSMLSVVISTPGTVVWYDHWEDGFEDDVTKPTKSSTQIWGDMDPTNGCAPGVNPCTKESDVLNAGQAIIVQNGVSPDSNVRGQDKKFDGSDRIMASFPIAVTRAAYPDQPGSYMAGAVEVLEMKDWGKDYIVPAGVNTYSATNAFEYTEVYAMAGEDNTTITFANGKTVTLNMGESVGVKEAQGADVKEGDKITADKPIQIDLVTGDKNSWYELR